MRALCFAHHQSLLARHTYAERRAESWRVRTRWRARARALCARASARRRRARVRSTSRDHCGRQPLDISAFPSGAGLTHSTYHFKSLLSYYYDIKSD